MYFNHINLRPFTDTGCMVAYENTPCTRIHACFRRMGSSHIAVLDKEGNVVGLVTRRDLITPPKKPLALVVSAPTVVVPAGAPSPTALPPDGSVTLPMVVGRPGADSEDVVGRPGTDSEDVVGRSGTDCEDVVRRPETDSEDVVGRSGTDSEDVVGRPETDK